MFSTPGVAAEEIATAARFGERIVAALGQDEETKNAPLLTGLGAARVVDKLIASEKIGVKIFRPWSRLMAWAGPPGGLARRLVISVYILFLLIMIVAVVPVNLVKNAVTSRRDSAKALAERRYYQAPSGE